MFYPAEPNGPGQPPNKRRKGHSEEQGSSFTDSASDKNHLIPGRVSLISHEKMRKLVAQHISQRLPDCDEVFPWLHGYSGATNPPHSCQWLAVIRSQPLSQGLIENSGLLKSSLDPHEFLMTLEPRKHHLGSLLSNVGGILNLTSAEIKILTSACERHKLLPFLISDAKAQSWFGAGANKHSVGKSSSKHDPPRNWKQPGMFRRFDLQVAKFVEMSRNCVVYCLDQTTHYTSCPCCGLALLIHVARRIVDPKGNFRISVLDSTQIDPEWWGTPPMKANALKKVHNSQLASDFDVASFNNWDRDLFYRERLEISKMSSASCVNADASVWCGNSTDFEIYRLYNGDAMNAKPVNASVTSPDTVVTLPNLRSSNDDELIDTQLFNLPRPSKPWRLFLHCSESSCLPELSKVTSLIEHVQRKAPLAQTLISFPNSGSIGLGNLNLDSIKVILNMCLLLYSVGKHTNCGSLIYCSDGYTETSFLLVAFLIFVWDQPLDKVLIRLHGEVNRPFFLFPIDLQVLGHLQILLREQSPRRKEPESSSLDVDPELFSKMFFTKVSDNLNLLQLKGPLPSKILPHLYLGSLEHAQNPKLLQEIGIKNIVSVGETMPWLLAAISRKRSLTVSDINDQKTCTRPSISSASSASQIPSLQGSFLKRENGCAIIEENGFRVLHITNLDDNGEDHLLSQLDEVLSFIEECYNRQEKVLVHCMVGVSRSATVCIAECMRRLNCDVLRAYLYVRVRRLNIIIQPNLMFVYELCKWQETHGRPSHVDWHIICRAISELNSVYF